MDELSYNAEHYRDPTVFQALKHVMKEEKEKQLLQEKNRKKRNQRTNGRRKIKRRMKNEGVTQCLWQ